MKGRWKGKEEVEGEGKDKGWDVRSKDKMGRVVEV